MKPTAACLNIWRSELAVWQLVTGLVGENDHSAIDREQIGHIAGVHTQHRRKKYARQDSNLRPTD
jgi:hypothetical protein